MVGGFYVAELLGAGREAAVVAAAGMITAVVLANAAGVRATARLQLGLAGVLAALRPARLGRRRHGGQPADAVVHRLKTVSHLAGELRDPARQLPRATRCCSSRSRST